MKRIKKALSLLLVFCMVFSMTANVYATEDQLESPAANEAVSADENIDSDTAAPVDSSTDEVLDSADESDTKSSDSTSALTEEADNGEADSTENSEEVANDETTVIEEADNGEADSTENSEKVANDETTVTEDDVTENLKTESDKNTADSKAAAFSLDNEATAQDDDTTEVETKTARSTSGDDFYKIVHLDAGRKYFSPENIKKIIDNAAAAGFNQLELYLSDNQGFRFTLDDMNVTTSTGNTYNLTSALGDGYSDGSKYPDGSGKYLTQSEMTGIISYAKDKGIDIVPCINTPGHMGAILEEFTQFKYSGSNSSIDLENTEAVAFALAIVEKYATYFESQGVKFFNLGADEYANDLSTMGFQGLYTSGKYQKFVNYLNNAAQIVINHNMTPRAFNDGIYYNEDNTYSINSAIQVCYWSCGWSGYNLASAQYLVNQGMDVINTHGDYYWVLGNSNWKCSADKASQFDYTSFQYRTGTTGNGTISDPAGAMFCIWCDVGNANGADDGTAVVSATADVIAAFGAALPASETGEESGGGSESSGNTGDNNNSGNTGNVEVTENETITVIVGQTTTATISGANYAGTYTTEDPSIATVNVTGADATTKYTRASVKCNTLIDNNSDNWTAVSGYYYKADDGNYYPVYAKRSSKPILWWTSYEYTWGYSTTSSTSNVTQIGTQSTTDTSTTPNITVYTKSNTDGTPASTTVTFTGLSVGTTYVTVGNTRYTINVVAEDLSNVTPLTVELWITNSVVHVSKSDNSASSVDIAATTAYGEDGVDIRTLVPETAYSNYDGWIELHFWQAMRLDSDNAQTAIAGDDETADGLSFTKVRYYDGSWQYMTSDGKWTSFESGDQAVAYYMRHTQITKEVTTAMKDWGYSTDRTTPDTSAGNGQVALTVAVVYPDGTVSPTEGSMYANSTTIFNYWSGRDIGIIAPLNNSDYDIAKITVTDGTRTDNTTSNTWESNSTIEWDKITNAAGSEWYNETEVWNDTMDTEPVVNGNTSNITWSAKNTAKLVLIYLKPVHHESNLLVQWIDDSANGAVISSLEVVVAYDGSEDAITFLNGLKQTSDVHAGSITLDDNAYITNSSNVNQTFNKDITTIQGVAGQYTSGLYEYTGADISEDGKTLTLHYNLNSTNLAKQYVIDFGLPVNIPLTDLVQSTDQVENVVVSSNASYANGVITYTPSQVLNGIEAVTARVEYKTGNPTTFSIGFVPATTVYYEEGFLKLNGFSAGSKGTSAQAKEAVGNKTNNYGYDSVYTNTNVGPSNGTQATSTTYGDSAEFTFTGTGVDIYANCNTETGQLFIVVKNSKDAVVKVAQVKTALLNGTSDSTKDQAVTGYNVPVVSLDLGTNDTYTVVISHKKPTSESTGDTVNLDGFRVYGTLAGDDQAYVADNEQNPAFVELRDQVLAALSVKEEESQYANQIARDTLAQVYSTAGVANGAVLIDASDNTTADVQDLLDNGPKNELYLRPNQSVTFKLTGADNVQIGLKALDHAVTYKVNNGDGITLNTSTDMFYPYDMEKGKTITITNTGSEGILSITDIKFAGENTDSAAAAVSYFAELDEADLMPALMCLGFEPEPTTADATLNISVADYTGTELASTVLTANGTEGEDNVFAAADIAEAAKSVLPEGYALADETAVADQTVVYGEDGTVTVQAGKVATLNVTYKKLFGKTVGTVVLTKVQTSDSTKATFSASEIRAAVPEGYTAMSLIGTSVKYGSESSKTVYVY
ncbi:MAG: family 20 glycosylhydrolase [Lachnospiraceae bacterium]|nr:family 20 glycosylhydrolase [Lachnospiraceae bacterium]